MDVPVSPINQFNATNQPRPSVLCKKCVINVTQIKSVDKKSIKEKIGTLPQKRIDEVHEGLKIVMSLP
jgi:mRNA-degrading endonuclease toxin of MazEF toxin-antitoxin module